MNQAKPIAITSFYFFQPLKDLPSVQTFFESYAQEHSMRGLMILANEGVNATLSCCDDQSRSELEKTIQEYFKIPRLSFKHSQSPFEVFKAFRVKVRPEIVTLGTPELCPALDSHKSLTPKEWHQVLTEEKDFLLIDTRNWYETKIGKFKNAWTPNTDQFTEFPQALEKKNIPKDKKILIYCTGGIRCEKGILEMERRGYKNVYQLQGGILKYLEEFPRGEFEGECFVFDKRMAVDCHLVPTEQYTFCPHTGQPASELIECVRCGHWAKIATEVLDDPVRSITCSKNCAYHWNRSPDQKGLHQSGSLKEAAPKLNQQNYTSNHHQGAAVIQAPPVKLKTQA